MSSFSKDVVRKIIEKYENYPELYNVQNSFYKNKTKRQECLNIITKEVNESCSVALTIDDIKKKINGLRTQFFNEISKERKGETSGKGRHELYKSNWWCMELLHFLKNSAPVRHGESNLKITSTDGNESTNEQERMENDLEILYDGPVDNLSNVDFDMLSPDEMSRPSTSYSEVPSTSHKSAETPRNKRKRSGDQSQPHDLLRKATSALEQVAGSSVVEDHLDTFGKLIATELRRIKNPRTVNRMKRDIMNLVFDTLDEEQQL